MVRAHLRGVPYLVFIGTPLEAIPAKDVLDLREFNFAMRGMGPASLPPADAGMGLQLTSFEPDR